MNFRAFIVQWFLNWSWPPDERPLFSPDHIICITALFEWVCIKYYEILWIFRHCYNGQAILECSPSGAKIHSFYLYFFARLSAVYETRSDCVLTSHSFVLLMFGKLLSFEKAHFTDSWPDCGDGEAYENNISNCYMFEQ